VAGSSTSPTPVTAIVGGELPAVLTKDMLPVKLPEVDGINSTTSETDWPAIKVMGRVGAVTRKPSPLTLACEMVTLATLAVTLTVCELLLPTGTVPKFNEIGSAAN
jgi:hypothetical protein